MHSPTTALPATTRRLVLTAVVVLLGLLALLVGRADATHGGLHPTTTLLASGSTTDRIVVKTHPNATSAVRTISFDFAENATTGWHTHPGPGIVTIVSGTFLLQRAEAHGCSERVLQAGDVFLDDGTAHALTATSAGKVVATLVTPKDAAPSQPVGAPSC